MEGVKQTNNSSAKYGKRDRNEPKQKNYEETHRGSNLFGFDFMNVCARNLVYFSLDFPPKSKTHLYQQLANSEKKAHNRTLNVASLNFGNISRSVVCYD